MLLGHLLLGATLPSATTFPLIMGALSVVTSIIGTFFVGSGNVKKEGIMNALYSGMIIAGVLSAIGFYFIAQTEFGAGVTVATQTITAMDIFICALVGLFVTGLITYVTEYYTGTTFPPVKNIASASVTGHATNIIAGLAVSMHATALPGIVIVIGILVANGFAGLYGVGIAVMSMLSMAGIVVAIDSFGPITDNAGGIAEMAKMPEDVRNVTDPLDAVGNTTKAVTKGYAIGSAGLAAVVLFSSYTEELQAAIHKINPSVPLTFDLSSPYVLCGLFLGGLIPYLFAAMAMEAV